VSKLLLQEDIAEEAISGSEHSIPNVISETIREYEEHFPCKEREEENNVMEETI
jgi:hypothetical protein